MVSYGDINVSFLPKKSCNTYAIYIEDMQCIYATYIKDMQCIQNIYKFSLALLLVVVLGSKEVGEDMCGSRER
jgi:hypothetical protein